MPSSSSSSSGAALIPGLEAALAALPAGGNSSQIAGRAELIRIVSDSGIFLVSGWSVVDIQNVTAFVTQLGS